MNRKVIYIVFAILAAGGVTLSVLATMQQDLRKGNQGKIPTFENKVLELEGLVNNRFDQPINTAEIDASTKEIKQYQGEIDRIKKFFAEKSADIKGKYFGLDVHKTSGVPDANSYYFEYRKRLKELSKEYIEKCGANEDLDSEETGITKSFPSDNYVMKWHKNNISSPKKPDIVNSMRQYAILDTLFSRLSISEVHTLKKISMEGFDTEKATRPGGNRPGARPGTRPGSRPGGRNKSFRSPYFDLIDVTIECRIDAGMAPQLIRNVLSSSRVIFLFEGYKAVKADNDAPAKNKEERKKSQLKNGVDATFKFKIMDFSKSTAGNPS